jgi:threonine dehydrogenase-like Zn-dependent dehydrogenase
VKDAIEAVRSGVIDPTKVVTHHYRLDQLGEALDATRDRPDGFVKAVVTT